MGTITPEMLCALFWSINCRVNELTVENTKLRAAMKEAIAQLALPHYRKRPDMILQEALETKER